MKLGSRSKRVSGNTGLKAIDAIWHELPKKERDETIEALTGDQELRELLFRSTRPVIAKHNQHH